VLFEVGKLDLPLGDDYAAMIISFIHRTELE